ncbi:SusC/RagA family TonB-linked outer membrane protein [Dinghuibacter silviterrae]|uniref:TonB-linked SusC/RagA family outer membrane protein n=1 Tax=Dinghuibacter silviterrae TaxID=1539049 RepID=A0A4R8DMD6_9BACT|nr:SusC/RagA family TonB-linked outer membrane protein [Dinghuibacter silviterrae]TDW99113.1 TonB-linked SusC/RagA family outer membrane protein [Dinghuibacter silviterrae]
MSKLAILVLLFLSSTAAFGQNVLKVRGEVTGENGQPVPRASVVVKGTGTGAACDSTGNFVIMAPSGGTLIISSIGYAQVQVPVNGRSRISVTMSLQNNSTNEIVVIGYGSQRKGDVTGSVASINGDNLRAVPSANISDALQGRVAGVELASTDSRPGAAMQIRIRGTRSLNATNDPLIVLDGIPFPGTITDIDPSEIKSIDILKDASATAIYGSRGANGVILVTTNKGMAGQQPRLSYSGYAGFKKAIKYPLMNGPQFVKLRDAAGLYNKSYGTDEDSTKNIDWQDLLYTTGLVTSHDVNVSAGTDKGSYQFGGTYYRDEAVIPMQNYTRYSFHGSVDQGVGKFIRIGFSSNSNYAVTNGSDLNAGTTLSTTPIANPYNADGSLKRVVNMALDQNWVYTKQSLDALGDQHIDLTRAFSSYNALYGELKIPGVPGLKYRANIGVNYRQSNYGNYTGEGVFSSSATTPSTATISNSHTTNWAIENLLTYDRTFAEVHKINAVALYSTEQTTAWNSQVSAMDIPNDAFQFYNLGQAAGQITVDPNAQAYSQKGLISYMGRVMYSYNDKYMLSATLRSDGSSVLATGHKWHTYTAVSGGWDLTRESFMRNISAINQLKLRVGYGGTSNQSINPYQTLGQLSTYPYNFGPSDYVTGYYVSLLPNPSLGWEYSKTWNYGVDFSLLKDRLSGTVEYYSQKTNDVLLYVSLPATTGVSSVLQNIGNTQNKGVELSLNGVILQNKNGWTVEAGVNVYANRNKLTSLASGETEDVNNWWFVGHPIDVIYDYKKVGLWNTTDKNYQYLQDYEPGGTAGMIKVQYTGTYNPDGSPTRANGAADRQILNIQPNFQGGFNTRVAYKKADLTIVGVFQDGGTLISTLYGSSSYLDMLSGRRENINVNYWTPTNTGAPFPNPAGPINSNNPKYGSTLGYFDASYMKIRTISLGYNFAADWMKHAGIHKLRVYVTAQDPFILFSPYHKLSHMDPESNSYGTQNQAVSFYPSRLLVVGTNTPNTRNYLVGVNLTF